MKHFLLILCVILGSGAQAAETRISMSAFSTIEKSPMVRLCEMVYKEAFKRLGIEFEFKYMPARRASIEANNGDTDGEPARRYDYGERFPNLIRIDEAVFTITMAAFSANPKIHVDGWETILDKGYRIDYLRGMTFVPDKIKNQPLFELNERSQAFQRLLSGRADLYIDGELDIRTLLNSPEHANTKVFEAGVISRFPVYGYLHRKHIQLVPRLSEVLKQMKKEGLIEKFEQQVTGK